MPKTEKARRGAAHILAAGTALAAMVGLAACSRGSGNATAQSPQKTASSIQAASACPGDNGGLSLSPGFCATVFADSIGHARHLVVAADGTLYANTWSGRYYRGSQPAPHDGFLVAMKDSNGDGKADSVQRFGDTLAAGGTGGTGIQLYNGAIYAEDATRILRYPLTPGSDIPTDAPQVVLSGLPVNGDHNMHPFIIDAKGALFVDLGTATNACQVENRSLRSPGHQPCIEKQTRGGIWRYDANKTGQVFSAAGRYATGIRNGEGMAFDDAGHLFVTQHGRDQLNQNWPKLYTVQQGENLPAEELVQLVQGADYGWPECYYDQYQRKLVLAPEYGGDGGKKVGVCAGRKPPVADFPAHWAPNDLAIYHGTAFPAAYRGGAFIAFHGSWNRAPGPQGGYNVVFQPLANGAASGPFIVFADGFAGADKDPGKAAFRPSGLAVGPDGALYVSDDVHGRIWRITYHGNASDKVAPAPAAQSQSTGQAVLPPEGIHPDAGAPTLTPPPGATAEQVSLGKRIFDGQADNGTCSGCHGSDAVGTPMGPALTSGHWLWSNGSLAGIASTIEHGVPNPKNYSGAMPPLGGAQLSTSDVKAVAAYVWAVGHAPKS